MSDELELRTIEVSGPDVQVRDAAKREMDVRIMPWDVVINTNIGPETFARGAFAGTDPGKVMLMGMEHEVMLGLGQSGNPKTVRRPTGKGIAIWETADGAYMTFRVSKTQRGDEILALAEDGIATGASIEFAQLAGGSTTETRNGRRTTVHNRVALHGLSTTYNPGFAGAEVIAVRTADKEEPVSDPVADATPTPAAPATITDVEPGWAKELKETFSTQFRSAKEAETRLEAAIARIEEKGRADFVIPSADADKPTDFRTGDWTKLVLRMMTGEKVSQSEIEMRTAADLITTDNLGVVPDAFLPEIIGIIDPARPFLQSTRKLNTPAAGMQMNVPKIVTRPTVGVQAEEKDELVSTATSITNVSFDAVTVGGYGDISIQLLKRSDPSYLDLYLELLAEAYAAKSDDLAVDVLIAASGIHTGTALDPDNLLLGEAWANAAAVSTRLTPDTIWMSADAVREFIDAKASGTNAPLYSNLAGNFRAGSAPGGDISGLRPVYVPALNDEAVDVIVGPSRGFAWAEDGTFTLQVDVPAKAGRDVALVGIEWFLPLYPTAFTKFALSTS